MCKIPPSGRNKDHEEYKKNHAIIIIATDATTVTHTHTGANSVDPPLPGGERPVLPPLPGLAPPPPVFNGCTKVKLAQSSPCSVMLEKRPRMKASELHPVINASGFILVSLCANAKCGRSHDGYVCDVPSVNVTSWTKASPVCVHVPEEREREREFQR